MLIVHEPQSTSGMIRAGTACTVYAFSLATQYSVDLARFMLNILPDKITVITVITVSVTAIKQEYPRIFDQTRICRVLK